jgi:hypothetical protein
MRGVSRRGVCVAVAIGGALLVSSIAASRPYRWGWAARHHRWAPQRAVWSSTSLTRADAARLRPGQYIWRGGIGRDPISMLIDLERQIAYVYQGPALIGVSTISSGRRGHETPTGLFPILQKAVWHRSTLYSGAPMPYMERLTWGGVALHAGGVPGYRQSHGCIHLPRRFAQELYAVTSLGAMVEVTHSLRTPTPMLAATVAFPTTATAFATMTAELL